MKKATKEDIIIKEALVEKYSDVVTELNHKNDFELLIAIILSAQCTDKWVNIITPKLFEKHLTPFDLSEASLEEVKVKNEEDLKFVKEYKVKPFLEEYFYADDTNYKKGVKNITW